MSGDPEYEGYVKPMAEPQPVPTCTLDFNIQREGVCNQLVLLECFLEFKMLEESCISDLTQCETDNAEA